MDCTICNEIKEDAPKMELLCGHSFHTECWIGRHVGHGLNGIRCGTCNEYIVPDELHVGFTNLTQVQESDKSNIIKYLLESDEEFRKTLLDIRKMSSKRSSYVKKLYAKVKDEIKNEEMLIHVSFLKNRLKEIKSELKESEDYKTLNSVDRSCTAKVNKLHRRWGITVYEACRALSNTENKKYLPTIPFRIRLARILGRIRYNIYP
jgi:hypothetical protein